MARNRNEGGTAVMDEVDTDTVRVGDIVNYVSLFGPWPTALNSTVHAAIVDGIYPDGDLALFAFGRNGGQIKPKVKRDDSGEKMDTWHPRPR